MKQTISLSQNMGAEPAIAKNPNFTFPTGRQRPTFNNQLIKKKEFQSINTVNAKGPDNKFPVMIPLKEHVKASYSNGDLKKMSFVGRENIVNTFYTPPIQIKQPFTSSAGLSSVDTGLLSGLGEMGNNVAKGVAMLTMQNILRIDNDPKLSLKSVFNAEKQRMAEMALQSYKSRQAAIASSRWTATEISEKNKQSIDLYIREIEPLIDSADEKKKFNEILTSSSSSLTQKLMPVDPTALTPAPSGASSTALADALKSAVIEGMKASAPAVGAPAVGAPAVGIEAKEESNDEEEEEEEDADDVKTIALNKGIRDEDVELMIDAMTGPQKRGSQDLTLGNITQILVEAKLNEAKEFKGLFQQKQKRNLNPSTTKEILVKAMRDSKEGADILENIAYGVITNQGTATQVWKEIRDKKVDYKALYENSLKAAPAPPTPVPALSANGRKRKKNTQNKAKVNLSEIAKILKKYQ